MKSLRAESLIWALGIAALTAAIPATAGAQGTSPPDTTHRATAGQAPGAAPTAKGARPASGPDLVTAKRGAKGGATATPAAAPAATGAPQAPVKVKRRVP